jgi:hypothetical protein
LIPLTHDHHHGIKHARWLKLAAKKDETERAQSAQEFLDLRSEALIHFREEEELLFPAILEHESGAGEAIGGLLLDHVKMHGFVARHLISLDPILALVCWIFCWILWTHDPCTFGCRSVRDPCLTRCRGHGR